MDMPVNVPVDNPEADTEWNDILRKHGIIPEKPPSPTPVIEEAILEARRLAHETRLKVKELDELAELEDDEDEEFLAKYRQQRLAELSTISKASIHGQVYPLQKPDYSKDVTEASQTSFVSVNLTSPLGANVESRLLSEMWHELARKYGDVKFCEIRADMCIEGYPERNCPTILVYHKGDIVKQVVTLKDLHGQQTTLSDLEKMLVSVGAINSNDHRALHLNRSSENTSSSIRDGVTASNPAEDDDDSD